MKLFLQRTLLAFVLLIGAVGSVFAQPTDNPYATFYGRQFGHWTDSLPWSRIYNINNFTGATMVERYNKARDTAFAAGGGIVYFPAGDYIFEDGITLKAGVIIRGDNPIVNRATDSAFSPPTHFVFPQYIPSFTGSGTPNNTAFKRISAQAYSNNCGIVYVDVNFAGISIQSQTFVPVQTTAGLTSWNIENNHNIMVFGCRVNNVASPDGGVPSADQNQWQRFCNRFTTNIGCYAARNIIVSNNRLNDFQHNTVHPIQNASYMQPGYLATKRGVVQVVDSNLAMFSYTDHYGINVNRKASLVYGTPETEPGLFAPGVEINDNWLYKTMRVGIIAAGLGMQINRNEVHDQPGKQIMLTPQGTGVVVNYSATYENRGIDWSGWHVQVIGNKLEVLRHKFAGSNYLSVDGEGILLQECCGGTSVNGFDIKYNELGGSGPYIGIYKTRDVIGGRIIANNMGAFGYPGNFIQVEANTNGTIYALSNTIVDSNYNVKGSIVMAGTRGGVKSYIRENTGSGSIKRACHVITNNNQVFTDNGCTQVTNPDFPEVTLLNPLHDTLLTDSIITIPLIANLVSGAVDSIDFYDGVTRLARVPVSGPNYDWQVPNANTIHLIAAKATDTSGQVYFTNPVKIKVCLHCTYTGNKPYIPKLNAVLFPNPSSENNSAFLRLPLPNSDIQITLTDLSGKVVQVQNLKLENGQVEFSVPNLPKGTWLLSYLCQNRKGTKLMIRD